ncbi:hypothetical protein [Actinopolyspora halophila]|uniref:hypothetical protein n=1 Tax=Actinopolyspora halophila TaxID=1850 RepID=UPI000369A61F|nr:hypothetical protein [Actinopolyspora halophila]
MTETDTDTEMGLDLACGWHVLPLGGHQQLARHVDRWLIPTPDAYQEAQTLLAMTYATPLRERETVLAQAGQLARAYGRHLAGNTDLSDAAAVRVGTVPLAGYLAVLCVQEHRRADDDLDPLLLEHVEAVRHSLWPPDGPVRPDRDAMQAGQQLHRHVRQLGYDRSPFGEIAAIALKGADSYTIAIHHLVRSLIHRPSIDDREINRDYAHPAWHRLVQRA